MKASKLIEFLEAAIDEYGDLFVHVHNGAGELDSAETVELAEDEGPRGTREVILITP